MKKHIGIHTTIEVDSVPVCTLGALSHAPVLQTTRVKTCLHKPAVTPAVSHLYDRRNWYENKLSLTTIKFKFDSPALPDLVILTVPRKSRVNVFS